MVEAAEAERGLSLVTGRVEDFAAKVHRGLDGRDRRGTREIVRALVRRIEVDGNAVEVVFRVQPPSPDGGPEDAARDPASRVGNIVGTIVTRLIGAVPLERNDDRQTDRRYMQLEGMAELPAPAAEPKPAKDLTQGRLTDGRLRPTPNLHHVDGRDRSRQSTTTAITSLGYRVRCSRLPERSLDCLPQARQRKRR